MIMMMRVPRVRFMFFILGLWIKTFLKGKNYPDQEVQGVMPVFLKKRYCDKGKINNRF